MTTQPTHTPTPWLIRPAEVGENKFQIRHETERNDGMWWVSVVAMTSDQICEEHGGTPEANAAFIVKAVNMHEEMLRALKDLLVADGNKDYPHIWENAKRILAKAEGK